MNDLMSGPVAGGAPESEIARDMVRRSLPAIPVVLLVAALFWGINGALSAGYGMGLVLVNFLLAAALLTWAARISLTLVMVAALSGFMIRLALIWLAVWLVRDAVWVELLPLGLTIIIAHLGLLLWETRHVSASLAFPGLKPSPKSNTSGGVTP
ncbi:MAG: hypothetical protein ACI8Y4_001877 [Candidatus Poriferisodalaceae bacterium]|jgi:hypothetical protein